MSRKRHASLVASLVMACLVCAAGCATPEQPSGVPTIPTARTYPLQESMDELVEAVEDWVVEGRLKAGEAASLLESLEAARMALSLDDPSLVQKYLRLFQREALVLIETGTLPEREGQRIVTQASGLLADLAAPESPEVTADTGLLDGKSPGESGGCPYTTLFVDATAGGTPSPDGSEDAPFASLTAALEQARSLGLCGVELKASDGLYRGDLLLSRPTRVVGTGEYHVVVIGSILNGGGFDLDLRDLTIRVGGPAGGVLSEGVDTKVRLNGVRIEGAQNVGLYQRGGALTVLASEIVETRASEQAMASGTGIYLEGGVQAVVYSTDIEDNESTGLAVLGQDTRVYASGLTVRRNQVNPLFPYGTASVDDQTAEDEAAGPGMPPGSEAGFLPPALTVRGQEVSPYFYEGATAGAFVGFGAVVVRQGALLLMEFCTLEDNQAVGLSVTEGARAHFRQGSISRTRAVVVDGEPLWGDNVLAIGSTLEMADFTIQNAGRAGLSLYYAYVTLRDGRVRNSPIGAKVGEHSDAEYDALACLQSGVTFSGHSMNLEASVLPVPEPVEVLEDSDSEPAPGACREVPFVCDWCGDGN